MNQPHYMSTSQVARHLGVSVATVKRWVDDGILPAHKTAGGHRRILQIDLQRVVRQNHFPRADPSEIARTTNDVGSFDHREVSRSLYRALLAGDVSAAGAILRRHYYDGQKLENLADDVVCPALTQVGNDWEKGKIDVYQEHHATRTCETVLIDMKVDMENSADDSGPIAIGGSPENDPTVVSSLLVQMSLLENGWQATNFGPHTPFSSLRNALRELRPKLLWLSVTHPLKDANGFLDAYCELHHDAEERNVAVAVGGRSLTPELRAKLPYTMFGDGMRQLAALARSLHSSYQRPQRGRPPLSQPDKQTENPKN